MFSSSVVRRGRCSLATPPSAACCNAIVLGQQQTAITRGKHVAVRIPRPTATETAPPTRRRGVAFRTGIAGRVQGIVTARSRMENDPLLGLKKEPISLLNHSEMSPMCVGIGQRRTFGVASGVHSSTPNGDRWHMLKPGVASSALRSRALQADGPVVRLDNRGFSAGKGLDGGSSANSSSSSDSSSESEFKGKRLGASAESAMEESEPAEAAVAAEAPAKKSLKPRKRKNIRKNDRAGSPATGAAAEGELAPAQARAAAAPKATAGATTAENTPESRKARKKHSRKHESNRSPAARAAVAEEATAGAGERVPQHRKPAFNRARSAGVTRRRQESGGVLRDTSNSSKADTQSSGYEKKKQELDDDSPVRWNEGKSSPSTWREPDSPVRPESFVSGSGTDARPGTKKGPRSGETQETHPVLGQLVADLKYKQVYVTSIQALADVQVWQKKRTLRPVRAVEIFEAKSMEAQKLEVRRVKEGAKELKDDVVQAKGMPGVITLYRRPRLRLTKRNQKYVLGIVDGQHRLGALQLLAEGKMWDPSERNVIVEVFDTKKERDIEELFAEINSAEPALIDPNIPGPAEVQKCADEVVLHLFKRFRPMFGGPRVRPPSLSVSEFKENLVNSGVIQRHELFNPHLLLDYLLRVNDMLSKRDKKTWGVMVGDGKDCFKTEEMLLVALKRAEHHKFFLGMELSWMRV